LAACYFPPADSTHWKRNRVDPFDTLLTDLADISGKGNFIITGDLNARTGTESDMIDVTYIAALAELGDHDLTSALSPLQNAARFVYPDRVSSDHTINNFGRSLLHVCSSSTSCILNGRLPGDLMGACTFTSKSCVGTSLVDYYISSPTLFFDSSGAPRQGAELIVLTDNDFHIVSDHWPVALTLPHGALPHGKARTAKPHWKRRKKAQCPQKRWVWNDQLQNIYTEALSTGNSATLLQTILEPESDNYIHMIDHLRTAVYEAADKAGLKRTDLFPPPQTKTRKADRASAPWYGMECTIARQRIKAATSGADQLQATRSYQKTVRMAKRRYSRAREAKMADMLKNNPKQFWRTIQRSVDAGSSITKQQLLDHYRNLRVPPAPIRAADLPCATFDVVPDLKPHDPDLDEIFDMMETVAALDKLKHGKTADYNGDITELFTKACTNGTYLLARHLTHIMNAIFISGTFPTSESLGMIISIYKGKGDTSDCNNYRGITIITVLSKLYATMLNNRIAKWRLGSMDRRARGQGGFLKDHRTTDHLFMLQHMIDRYRIKHKPLYTCFVDLSKAFDTVSRPKLWQRLTEMGIGGRMLLALQSYYADVRECVKTTEGLTDSFPSSIGVKQGCPLSPTLFGLYIDAVEDFICKNMAGNGTAELMFGQKVPLLLYADDIVFFATSEKELQQIMDIFSDFCYKYELTVNLKKTEVVVFSSCILGITACITYRGNRVPQNTEYKYLGIIFHARHGAKKGGEALLAVAKRALYGLQRKMRSENITNPKLALRLFDSLITPIITYGSEIWGCYGSRCKHEADQLYLNFIKNTLNIPKGTDTEIVLAESGCLPFHTKIWESQARYWARLKNIEDNTRLIVQAFTESMVRYGKEQPCWCSASVKGGRKLGLNISYMDGKNVREFMAKSGREKLRNIMHATSTDHRDFYTHYLYVHDDGARRRTYANWFWQGEATSALDMNDLKLRNELLRFRLGAHGLRATTGAWNGIERRDRLCRCCNMGIVEDEFHFIYECPLYHDIRYRFMELFEPDVLACSAYNMCINIGDCDLMMSRLFVHEQKHDVLAKFIATCRARRDTVG
jgi:hypothetical protein